MFQVRKDWFVFLSNGLSNKVCVPTDVVFGGIRSSVVNTYPLLLSYKLNRIKVARYSFQKN